MTMIPKNSTLALKGVAASCVLAGLALAPRPVAAAQCTVTQQDLDGNGTPDLKILGSSITQKLIIDAYQSQTIVSLDCNGGGFLGPPNSGDLNQVVMPAFGRYELRLKGKDDVTFNVADDWSNQTRSIEVYSGGGVNKLTIGGPGALTAGSRLSLDLQATFGTDRLTLNVPTLLASSFLVKADLFTGNDLVTVNAANAIGAGSVAAIKSEASGGVSGFVVNFTGTLAGTLDLSYNGSPAKDTVTALFAGHVANTGRLDLQAHLWAYYDTFVGTVDLGAFGIDAGGEAHLDVVGGGGGDVLKLTPGTSVGGTSSMAGLFDVSFKGADGNDVISIDLGAGGFVTNGTLRLRADGESAKDNITGIVDLAAGSLTPVLDATFNGGHFNDIVNLTINDNSSGGASYGPAGTAFLDGGAAIDVCTVAGSGVVHKRNCEK
jgi:hypothetical protein